jgi:WhiB family redox-sensing transcriptional regulator
MDAPGDGHAVHGATVSAAGVPALRTLLGMPELLTPEVCAWMMSTTSIDQALPSLEDLTNRPAWTKRAACRGEDPALFLPTRGVSGVAMARARAVCAGCTVRADCLDYASATVDTMGVWGGTTERERRGMRVVA